MLDRFPSGWVACVSDSYDVLRACREHWGKALRDRVLQRDGTLVVRPDSGDPPEIVTAVLESLADAFATSEPVTRLGTSAVADQRTRRRDPARRPTTPACPA